MNRTPRIATLLDDTLNGVSLWRTMRPWSDLHRAGAIELRPIYRTFNEHDAFLFDVLYISHPRAEMFVKIIEAANLAGALVWVDMDDDLMDVPVHNFKKHTIDRGRETTAKIIGAADVFTVSTQEIADKYATIAKTPPVVIPNTVHPGELRRDWNYNNRCLWRSNISQVRDMWVNWRDHERMEKAGISTAFLGAAPPWVDEPKWSEWGPAMSYFRELRKTEAAYFWKPLEDNTFNRCKSNIAMLEGAMCGALTVCNLKHERWRPAITAEEAAERNESWKRRRYADMLAFIEENYNSRTFAEVRYGVLMKALGWG